jgi:hypothetical protein
VDWADQADRFWASELSVAPGVLRTEGFHVFERTDATAQPRASMVGTSSATVVSLPAGQTQTFEKAGLSLKQMERAPRRYVASCVSIHSLEVRGPAYLAYWPTPSSRPPLGQAELLDGDDLASLESLRDVAPAEWEEAGIGSDSRVFGLRAGGQIVAVAGYERWSGGIAQLQVFCHPGHRRRGLAAERSRPQSGMLLPTICYRSIGREMATRRVSRWPNESGSWSTGGWPRFSSACRTVQCSRPELALLAPAADRDRWAPQMHASP